MFNSRKRLNKPAHLLRMVIHRLARPLSMLGKKSADDIMKRFLNFLENWLCHFMQIVYPLGKFRKGVINLSSAELAKSVVQVKYSVDTELCR